MIYFQNYDAVMYNHRIKYNNIFIDIEDVDEIEEDLDILEDKIQIFTNNLELFNKK